LKSFFVAKKAEIVDKKATVRGERCAYVMKTIAFLTPSNVFLQ